jgi:mRNA interferase RelE/StbE
MPVQNSDYQLVFTRSARKEAVGLPPKISDQIERATDRLLQAFQSGTRPQDMKPIQGRPGTYRVDSGEYRILFELDEVAKTITIIRVRHRKDVYRNL